MTQALDPWGSHSGSRGDTYRLLYSYSEPVEFERDFLTRLMELQSGGNSIRVLDMDAAPDPPPPLTPNLIAIRVVLHKDGKLSQYIPEFLSVNCDGGDNLDCWLRLTRVEDTGRSNLLDEFAGFWHSVRWRSEETGEAVEGTAREVSERVEETGSRTLQFLPLAIAGVAAWSAWRIVRDLT